MSDADRKIYSLNQVCEIEEKAYQKGRADKYQEIVSEYMLLTEEQVYQIREEAYQQGKADREKELSELPNEYSEKLWKNAYDRGYDKGRTDEQLQSIEDAKMQATEYLNALYKAKEEAYQQGYADAIAIDMDKPMHFTNEQKAWVKKYISINGERQRLDGTKEFAEWICASYIVFDTIGKRKWVEDLLAEWQKEVENE